MRAAFTLVELLVVIAVVSVLVAIATPSLLGTRASAERVACLKTLGHVMELHALESNANGGHWANLFQGEEEWSDIVMGETERVSTDVRANERSWPFALGRLTLDRHEPASGISCPVVLRGVPRDLTDANPQAGAERSYLYSLALVTRSELWDPDHPERRATPDDYRMRVPVSGVSYPAAKVAMFETHDFHGSLDPIGDPSVHPIDVNVACADGHAERVGTERAMPPLTIDHADDYYSSHDRWWPTFLPERVPFSASAWGYRGRDLP